MVTSLSKITVPITKSEQDVFSRRLITSIVDGDVDPLIEILKVKSLIESLDKVLKNDQVKDLVIKEVEKSGKTCSTHGVSFTVKEMSPRYDFTGCNDSVYEELVAEKKILDAKVKEREEFLRRLPHGGITAVNEKTGEVETINSPLRMAAVGFAISYPK